MVWQQFWFDFYLFEYSSFASKNSTYSEALVLYSVVLSSIPVLMYLMDSPRCGGQHGGTYSGTKMRNISEAINGILDLFHLT